MVKFAIRINRGNSCGGVSPNCSRELFRRDIGYQRQGSPTLRRLVTRENQKQPYTDAFNPAKELYLERYFPRQVSPEAQLLRRICSSSIRYNPATTCFIVDGSNLTTKHQDAGEVATENKVTNDVTKIEVVLEEAPMQTDDQIPAILVGPMPNPDLSPTPEVNATYPGGVAEPGEVVVRAEEALIVILVLVLWVAAIALFFNRWGKIRMLEPYQPKFQQQHRQSCAMIDPNPLQHRACSKFNIHCLEHPIVYPTGYGSNLSSRPRQNSVFVGSSMSLLPPQNAPRRAKSAFDIQTLVLAECTVQNTGDSDVPKRGREFGKSFGESLRIPELPRASSSVQRQRGMSICHFDRTDVLARPLMRERGMSICQFDRGDSLGKPPQRERGMSICQFDKQMPSCSKTPDVIHTYRATCV